jgi:putative nucleotidyltransferase with HDIG domain
MRKFSLSEAAEEIARCHLKVPLPQRWLHVDAVARKAARLADLLFAGADAEVLKAAAWLHDLGYAPDIRDTGFHPLDGAVWLRKAGFEERVCALVAYHTCADIEAEERGFADSLQAFPRETSIVADALLYADMRTGPDGQDFSVVARMDEVVSRYGEGHSASRFIERARPIILETAQRVETQLALRDHIRDGRQARSV